MTGLSFPNFRDRRARIIHAKDRNADALCDGLAKTGMVVSILWPAVGYDASDCDVVLFCADQGADTQFAWSPGNSPVPMIALLGSEAPGRVEWALSQEPAAFLQKPIRDAGIFSALTIAFHTFERRRSQRALISNMNDRIAARPFLLSSVQMMIRTFDIDEKQAFTLLRDESMRQRLSIEELCSLIVQRGSLDLLKRPEGAAGPREKRRR